MRKIIVAGNWKMYKTPDEAIEFVENIQGVEAKEHVRVIVCAPYLALPAMMEHVVKPLEISAQNVHQAEEGAFTGEISANMLKGIGVGITLVGHSERRQYFAETDDIVSQKVSRALSEGLEVILCVGESLVSREEGKEKDVVSTQLHAALSGVSSEDMKQLIVAYEPVWAIGTGRTASSKDAQDMAEHIRVELNKLYGREVAEATSLLYGGSVKPDNISELLLQPDVDGVLVGGASLDPESFRQLIEAGNKK
jgi:triosephosphate isomerase